MRQLFGTKYFCRIYEEMPFTDFFQRNYGFKYYEFVKFYGIGPRWTDILINIWPIIRKWKFAKVGLTFSQIPDKPWKDFWNLAKNGEILVTLSTTFIGAWILLAKSFFMSNDISLTEERLLVPFDAVTFA